MSVTVRCLGCDAERIAATHNIPDLEDRWQGYRDELCNDCETAIARVKELEAQCAASKNAIDAWMHYMEMRCDGMSTARLDAAADKAIDLSLRATSLATLAALDEKEQPFQYRCQHVYEPEDKPVPRCQKCGEVIDVAALDADDVVK